MFLGYLALAAALSLHACIAQSCGAGCNLHTLVFHDDFNSNAVDEGVWNYRTDQKGESAQLASNVAVANGTMSIALKKQTVETYAHTGGGLISKANFHYGFYETRMKLNHGSGWHSSFWQMAGNGSTTYSTASPSWTEFDTFEVDSINPSGIRHNIIVWSGGSVSSEQTSGVHNATVDYAADYHIFGTLWNETAVSFYTDGVVVSSFQYPAAKYPHDYLNIWLTCIGYNNPIDDSLLPSYVNTDYVQFYQRDYYLTASSLCRGQYQGSTPCPSSEGYKETGQWSQSALDGYSLALKSRYSCSVLGNAAIWSHVVRTPGTLQISAWIVAGLGSDPAAAYSVSQNGATIATVVVNQTSGDPRWVAIEGAVTVAANDVIAVTVKASGWYSHVLYGGIPEDGNMLH